MEDPDAGIASAVLNTSQQVGGSPGLALLNTVYASAVTGYLVDNPGAAPGAAFVQGYHVAFIWAAEFLAVALVISIVLIRAKKDDLRCVRRAGPGAGTRRPASGRWRSPGSRTARAPR